MARFADLSRDPATMASPRNTFVGFGFGAIQAGLFALEAQRSGGFGRIVIAEVVPAIVAAVRKSGGFFAVNVAASDRVERVRVGPVELLDPGVATDRATLLDALVEATEVATAVPSVRFYRSSSPGSIHRLLAEAISRRGGRPLIVYAAENHLAAAEELESAVREASSAEAAEALTRDVCFANTVIGKMSAVVTDPQQLADRGLAPVTPALERAFLVEEFRRILVSRVELRSGQALPRGLDFLEEKPDLEPFEEAKLYGHNATHALAGYLARTLGLERMEEIRNVRGSSRFLREAFLAESGAALRARWEGTDELFTPSGFAAYADDLLERMLNPWLGDSVERITRDPERKLGWDDRLVGIVRLALAGGIRPTRFALGVAAAARACDPERARDVGALETWLSSLWASAEPPASECSAVLEVVREGGRLLADWTAAATSGFPVVAATPE